MPLMYTSLSLPFSFFLFSLRCLTNFHFSDVIWYFLKFHRSNAFSYWGFLEVISYNSIHSSLGKYGTFFEIRVSFP